MNDIQAGRQPNPIGNIQALELHPYSNTVTRSACRCCCVSTSI